MRKQTKLVAALSATALLAVGASMTSFARGWTEIGDGEYVYLDSDGERVTSEWRRSGSDYFFLDENGEIEKYRVTGGGGNISGPTEEEQRQFEAEQAAKRKRREEYARLNEEAALKRRLMEQEADERYYKDSITKKTVSIATYEAAGISK